MSNLNKLDLSRLLAGVVIPKCNVTEADARESISIEDSVRDKFIDRNGRTCSKCESDWYWVNTMGGLECARCNPPPSTINIESRLLVNDQGLWKKPVASRHGTLTHQIKTAPQTYQKHFDIADVKRAAQGKWLPILSHLASIPHEKLDGKPGPCPWCGGEDRFRLIDDVEGAVFCNQCFNHNNGDGIAAVAHANGWNADKATQAIAGFLGMSPSQGEAVDIVAKIARLKRIPLESFIAFGAKESSHGKLTVVRLPMYDSNRKQCSHFDMSDISDKFLKGMSAKGKPVGLFVAEWPEPGDTVYVCEGAKDAAAARSLGLKVIGISGSKIAKKHARVFAGCHVILVPDLDKTASDSIPVNVARLIGIAASVRVARLPGEMKATDGDGIREALAQKGGEELVRQAIADAQLMDSSSLPRVNDQSATESIPDDLVTNALPSEEDESDDLEPIPMDQVIERINRATNRNIRSVSGKLFYHEKGTSKPVYFISTPDSLFGLIASTCPSGPPKMHKKIGCVTKSEVFSELQRLAPRFEAIEEYPHEPLISNHYYACEEIHAGDGETLNALLDFFNTETPSDRSLLIAYFATLLWGGAGGTRPIFVITSDFGRGAGKTSVGESPGYLFGGVMSFSSGEDAEEMKKRILSPMGMTRRAAMIDNLKSHRFSWAEFESLVTARDISGRQLYTGEGSRPNTITWAVTLNGVSLSTDIAQRSVVIQIKKPTYSGDWKENIQRFIEENRTAIIGDLITFLRSDPKPLVKSTRWGGWEKAVLSRVDNPTEAQQLILDRQHSSDVEREESGMFTDFIERKINGWLRFGDMARVFIPSSLMADWYSEAIHEKKPVPTVSRIITQQIQAGQVPQLIVNKDMRRGRGFVWCKGQVVADRGYVGHGSDEAAETIFWTILEYIADKKEDQKVELEVRIAGRTQEVLKSF